MALLDTALRQTLGKGIDACTDEELYLALLALVKERAAALPAIRGGKKLYYISAEFLIGKLLSNNLINLGLYDEIDGELRQAGRSLAALEGIEPEPSLGNGGLGRLSACFLDSIATLGLPGDGVGLNYHFGLFRQFFWERKQHEETNPWLQPQSWLTRRETVFPVAFRDFTLDAVLYDIDVVGYQGGTNRLRLFDIDSLNEQLVRPGTISFDKADIPHNLTLFLYPDDSDEAGHLLRVYQQYFLVSAAAQLILRETEDAGHSLENLHQHVAIQINDTHPSMIIPELIRLLTARGISFGRAVEIVSQACAYTNHTILAEALEKWPLRYIDTVAPQLTPILRQLDALARERSADPAVAIIDPEDRVHMAHLDIHFTHSINGVAALHTQILETTELKQFYTLYPEKFNNKTNGITFRRWLMYCNPELAALITRLIGEGWQRDAARLQQLMGYQDDDAVLDALSAIKAANKQKLRAYLRDTQGLQLLEDAVYDIQIKRIHEYKRQQMNALYAIHKYMQIKAGHRPPRPIVMIFGGKAAPAYRMAKDIIHVLLCLQALIAGDPDVSPWLQVVMVENYNVTLAEKLIPACDLSEQISLASKEASGTGNMKFMLNGAVTIGTLDGANVEIRDLVGAENIYIFGRSSEEVLDLYARDAYRSVEFYRGDRHIEALVDFLVGPQMRALGDIDTLLRVYKDLVSKDWFMSLLDLSHYIQVKDWALGEYENRRAWNRKMLVNTAMAGYFSSDRAIAQYNEDIWRLTPAGPGL